MCLILTSQIKTFALFRKWKAFSVWRKNVRTTKIKGCKKALDDNLFIVNPVSKHCHYELASIQLLILRYLFNSSFHDCVLNKFSLKTKIKMSVYVIC